MKNSTGTQFLQQICKYKRERVGGWERGEKRGRGRERYRPITMCYLDPDSNKEIINQYTFMRQLKFCKKTGYLMILKNY